MKEKTPYSYSVLRYVHDAATREFVNVGVVLYAPTKGFLKGRCSSRYRRAAALFGHKVDGKAFRQLTQFVELEINRLGDRIRVDLPLAGNQIETVLDRILPRDDSSIQFSQAGAGISSDLDRTLSELNERVVERYEKRERERRTEEDVWRVFRAPLVRQEVVQYLQPKKIVSPSIEYEFQYAWKNARWHALEPISFDLVDAQHMSEKAALWVGRMTGLQDAHEELELHVLLGAPQEDNLQKAFVKVQNLLHKMPGKHEFYKESEAETVAQQLAKDIREHHEP